MVVAEATAAASTRHTKARTTDFLMTPPFMKVAAPISKACCRPGKTSPFQGSGIHPPAPARKMHWKDNARRNHDERNLHSGLAGVRRAADGGHAGSRRRGSGASLGARQGH